MERGGPFLKLRPALFVVHHLVVAMHQHCITEKHQRKVPIGRLIQRSIEADSIDSIVFLQSASEYRDFSSFAVSSCSQIGGILFVGVMTTDCSNGLLCDMLWELKMPKYGCIPAKLIATRFY